ncbi:MAG: type II toxin-antitoxin system RelE/ParE family toxin [Kofleriaceae bacterium]
MRSEQIGPAACADVSITVEILPEAQRLIDEADERWISEHGFDSLNPLLDEILQTAELLRENPEIGVVYLRGGFRHEVRRLLLRSGWHVYYQFLTNRGLVEIVAIWFENRGSGPPL